MTTLMFPAETAAAIRDRVLPASLIANSGPLDRCPCQAGLCQACSAGRHKGCTHRRFPPNPAHPHTWITTRDAMVPNGTTGQVWHVGRPCVWVCTCPTCAHPRPRPADVTAPGNPPARVRSTREILALLDRPPAPPSRRRPTPRRREPAETRTTSDEPTLF